MSGPQTRPISGPRGLARGAPCDFSRLGQQRRVVRSEYLGAEAHRGINLALAEAAVDIAGVAQTVEQRAGAAVEVLLNLGEGTLRHLIDGKLAGEVAAIADKADK